MLDFLYKAALLTLGIGCMVAIIPLYIWGATGSWRAAMHALGSYIKIMGFLLAVGGGIGLLMSLGDLID